jgi:hypothetical protein
MTTLPLTLEINGDTWRTPLTGTGYSEHGNARLKPVTYSRSKYYRMEGTGGYEFFRVRRAKMPVMMLQRRTGNGWRTWMVDDPLHWQGMRELVMQLPPGRLLVAGLGLGLFAHHLLDRPDITDVDVIEIDPDVIALVTPTLPADPRRTVIEGDYYDHIHKIKDTDAVPDSILWDLAVGNQEQTGPDFFRARLLTAVYMTGVPLFQFGLRLKPSPLLV